MNTIWNKLSKGKRYRQQFVSANARRAFAFQLRSIMKKRNISQEKLAEMCGLSQGVISRAADPTYGTLTVTTKIKIANGLDMAYLGTLVPFSLLASWFNELSEEAVQVPTFEEENGSALELPALGSAETAMAKDRSTEDWQIAPKMGQGSAEKMGQYFENQAAA